MTKKDAIKVFEAKKIRAVWDEQKENGIASWRWTEKMKVWERMWNNQL